ncbi:hypothetical protein M8542_43520 [Amycolatopsis sp. OK19-0408]|uniref:Uncharacterized protein n=1 Tax=Amycolatopsis iheyensis TaxID=2945988 RepID=A0A9X2NKW8_9PSEU|nr:hypothetical protein [Amycolatopsis iheyensis]MCR6489702.1 hypothetical protein [Amycolatopsis iheyensis]
MKRIIVSIVVVLFGAMAIVGGVLKLDDTTARCDGRIMVSGDECVTTNAAGDETGRKSVDEQRKSAQGGNWVAIGAGALIVIFGTKSLITGIRRRGKQPDVAAAPAWQGAGAAPPVPGQPAAGPQGWNQPQQAGWQQPQAWQQAPPVPGQPVPPVPGQPVPPPVPGQPAPPGYPQQGWGPPRR